MIQTDLFQNFEASVLTVTQLNHYLRQLLEADPILQKIWIKGEVSNVSQPRSGHVYFTLKDDTASLNCVIWRSSAERLKILPENGMAVEARGNISVYEQGGRYQLYVDLVRVAGEGLLFQKFLALKAELEAEGLFDEEHKRPIPAYPHTIGIVTSVTGAAVQDMINTLMQRYPLAEIVLAPAAVQGEAAPLEILRALYVLNHVIHPDVILIGRGGGSLEDLWCFNDERVVRAIAASETPVISGIGHETDFTLADFAADKRAPTPTGAAVMAAPDIRDMTDQLGSLWLRLNGLMAGTYEFEANRFDSLTRHLRLISPLYRLQNEIQHLDEVERRLHASITQTLKHKTLEMDTYHKQLASLNPNRILERGYALVENGQGLLIHSIRQVKVNDQPQIILKDGRFTAAVQELTEGEKE